MSGTIPTAPTNAYTVKHSGRAVPISSSSVWFPNGQLLYNVNPADGTVSNTYGASSQSGNVITAGGPQHAMDWPNPYAFSIHAIGTASAATITEIWVYDGRTGIVQRYTPSTGAKITSGGSTFKNPDGTTYTTGDYQLTAGDTLIFVQTS